jgi:uroporphyrin-III C-methyltransferase / precorrin-2 dehydrogenase / sirohydrochlorin ferrochelatase
MPMDPLARLPAFFALTGKRCVVAGNGMPAAWKAELLAAAGARVDVFAPTPAEDIRARVAAGGTIALHERAWQPTDFAGVAIAVAECAGSDEAARFAAAAHATGALVNVIDRPAFCDFAFGAIVNRSPLVIGISTDGAAPVFAQAIRARIETLIPKSFARWAQAARNWRPRMHARAMPFRARRGFWERFAKRALAAPNVPPDETEFTTLLTSQADAGSVVLIGTGPGDPELLTLRAVRALQSADVILFDKNVAPEILDFARREAKRMLVGKTATATMVALAKSGRRVVRLKAGAGQAGEEAAACRAAGVVAEVVPGVTATQPAILKLPEADVEIAPIGAEQAARCG